jgi:hypothetical protein
MTLFPTGPPPFLREFQYVSLKLGKWGKGERYIELYIREKNIGVDLL